MSNLFQFCSSPTDLATNKQIISSSSPVLAHLWWQRSQFLSLNWKTMSNIQILEYKCQIILISFSNQNLNKQNTTRREEPDSVHQFYFMDPRDHYKNFRNATSTVHKKDKEQFLIFFPPKISLFYYI